MNFIFFCCRFQFEGWIFASSKKRNLFGIDYVVPFFVFLVIAFCAYFHTKDKIEYKANAKKVPQFFLTNSLPWIILGVMAKLTPIAHEPEICPLTSPYSSSNYNSTFEDRTCTHQSKLHAKLILSKCYHCFSFSKDSSTLAFQMGEDSKHAAVQKTYLVCPRISSNLSNSCLEEQHIAIGRCRLVGLLLWFPKRLNGDHIPVWQPKWDLDALHIAIVHGK